VKILVRRREWGVVPTTNLLPKSTTRLPQESKEG